MVKRVEKSMRKEALVRLLVSIVTGIVLYLWGYAVGIIIFINWLIVLIIGRKVLAIDRFCSLWADEVGRNVRYLTFESNEKAFPFNELEY
jgi:hypothetical protein